MKKLADFSTDIKSGRALKLAAHGLNFSMFNRVVNPLKITILIFGLGLFMAVSCAKREQPPDAYGVNFTPCRQTKASSDEPSDAVEVEFTNEGVKITHYDFEVTCDFTAIKVTHTFVDGVLSITQKGSPDKTDCICYTDVSFTIDGILREDVNLIFVNGEQVYCYNKEDREPKLQGTIVNENSSWATLSYGIGYDDVRHEIIPVNVRTQYVFFEGDSTFDATSYKKVFSCNDRLHENITYEGLIREQEKKTYFIRANSKTEYLLYDFSLEEGMIFEYIDPSYPMVGYEIIPMMFFVKYVDFVEINGVQKKRIQLASASFPYDDAPVHSIWIEGLGSLKGLFEACGILAPGSNKVLLCYFQNNELVYKNPEFSKCYYDDSKDIIIKSVHFTKTE